MDPIGVELPCVVGQQASRSAGGIGEFLDTVSLLDMWEEPAIWRLVARDEGPAVVEGTHSHLIGVPSLRMRF